MDVNVSARIGWAVLLIAATLACNAVWAQASATSTAAVPAPTLNRIRETGVVTLAHREASIPFSYLMRTSARSDTQWICACWWSSRFAAS